MKRASTGSALTLASVVAALTRARVFEALGPFEVRHVGTWPIGLAIETSDADIALFAPDLAAFRQTAEASFGSFRDFTIAPRDGDPPSLIVRFRLDALPVEIFASPTPVTEQNGWRHMLIEARLLQLATQEFRAAILTAKRDGMKTEPAFARLLGLSGDPYEAVLQLDGKSDAVLSAMLESRGYRKAAVTPDPPPHEGLKRPYTTKAARKANPKNFAEM